MTFQKKRAKIEILSSLLAFPTIQEKDWTTDFYKTEAKVGDLVSLCSAPSSEWYLSWVREIESADLGQRYLLESVENGKLCWWSNVGLNIYNRKRVAENQSWQWNDQQFDFYDRWHKVCYKWNDAYIVLPGKTTFNSDNTVTLSLRERHGGYRDHNKFHFERSFPWKRTTMKRLSEFYKEGVQACDKMIRETLTGSEVS